jgi:hypothetical protein
VVNYPDGRFAIQFDGATLGFKVFDKIQTVQPGAIVDNKRLSAVLEQVKAQQAAYPARQERGHIARQRPPNNLEAPAYKLMFLPNSVSVFPSKTISALATPPVSVSVFPSKIISALANPPVA